MTARNFQRRLSRTESYWRGELQHRAVIPRKSLTALSWSMTSPSLVSLTFLRSQKGKEQLRTLTWKEEPLGHAPGSKLVIWFRKHTGLHLSEKMTQTTQVKRGAELFIVPPLCSFLLLRLGSASSLHHPPHYNNALLCYVTLCCYIGYVMFCYVVLCCVAQCYCWVNASLLRQMNPPTGSLPCLPFHAHDLPLFHLLYSSHASLKVGPTSTFLWVQLRPPGRLLPPFHLANFQPFFMCLPKIPLPTWHVLTTPNVFPSVNAAR